MFEKQTTSVMSQCCSSALLSPCHLHLSWALWPHLPATSHFLIMTKIWLDYIKNTNEQVWGTLARVFIIITCIYHHLFYNTMQTPVMESKSMWGIVCFIEVSFSVAYMFGLVSSVILTMTPFNRTLLPCSSPLHLSAARHPTWRKRSRWRLPSGWASSLTCPVAYLTAPRRAESEYLVFLRHDVLFDCADENCNIYTHYKRKGNFLT